jgi:hypothetical protein
MMKNACWNNHERNSTWQRWPNNISYFSVPELFSLLHYTPPPPFPKLLPLPLPQKLILQGEKNEKIEEQKKMTENKVVKAIARSAGILRTS